MDRCGEQSGLRGQGEVKITPGFGLQARFIIYAVGPRHDQSGTLLSFCYLRALDQRRPRVCGR